MVIDEKLINYLEDLSFISLSNEERQRICADLARIIAGMELLSSLDTTELPISELPLEKKMNDFTTYLRKDEVKISFPRDEILKNAPEANGESFMAPKTVE